MHVDKSFTKIQARVRPPPFRQCLHFGSIWTWNPSLRTDLFPCFRIVSPSPFPMAGHPTSEWSISVHRVRPCWYTRDQAKQTESSQSLHILSASCIVFSDSVFCMKFSKHNMVHQATRVLSEPSAELWVPSVSFTTCFFFSSLNPPSPTIIYVKDINIK